MKRDDPEILTLKCYWCNCELDEDEEKRALADIKWDDPICDDCNFKFKEG